jgi:hypothetical protein
MTLKDGYVDTLSDAVGIAPWRVRFRVENKTIFYEKKEDITLETRRGPSDASALLMQSEARTEVRKQYFFNTKELLFSLSIDVDSTMAQHFEYRLVTPKTSASLGTAKDFIETKPQQALLTRPNGLHDEKHVYSISIDPNTEQGRRIMSQFTTVSTDSISSSYPAVQKREMLPGTEPHANYRQWVDLSRSARTSSGKKEFMIVFRFWGKYFGDERVFITRGDLFEKGSREKKEYFTDLFYDFYSPSLNFLDPSNEEYLNNGDTVTGSFDLEVTNITERDRGEARITSIELIVAEAPPEKVVEWNEWSTDSAVPVTLQELKSYRHFSIPYEIDVPLPNLPGVKWEGLDPASWGSGHYFMTIVASDEYGNTGIAPTPFSRGTNPWLVTVLTGK